MSDATATLASSHKTVAANYAEYMEKLALAEAAWAAVTASAGMDNQAQWKAWAELTASVKFWKAQWKIAEKSFRATLENPKKM